MGVGKVVIITGATGGIGSAIAKRFGRDGSKVLVNYLQASEHAEELVNEIRRAGGEAIAHRADVTRYSEVQEMVDRTLTRWGRIDVMVANAGGNLEMLGRFNKTIIDHDESDWDLVLNVNLKGAFFSVKAVAKPMMEQRDGHIVLVSSGGGVRGFARSASYAAAKAGVMGLMKTAAQELGEFNIQVNAVCPGFIRHERIAKAIQRARPEADSHYKPDLVLPREGGSSEEFADFIAHLVTMKNISGQTLNTDSRILF